MYQVGTIHFTEEVGLGHFGLCKFNPHDKYIYFCQTGSCDNDMNKMTPLHITNLSPLYSLSVPDLCNVVTMVDNLSICITKWIIILLTKGTQNLANDKKYETGCKETAFQKRDDSHPCFTNK